MTKIKCPNCGRVLGETNQNLDAYISCKGCKHKDHIKIRIVKFEADYLPERKQND